MQFNRQNTILLYNRLWGEEKSEDYTRPLIDDFQLTTDAAYFDKAVAVIFHMPTLSQHDEILNEGRKKRGQLWIFWSQECEVNYQWYYNPKIYNLFDIKVSYKLDADIAFPYFNVTYKELLRHNPIRKTHFANAFVSSNFNESRRIECLTELMCYLNIDSYGRILNNTRLENDAGQVTKSEIISKYKFTIAFENAIARDYVTEKFYQPLIAGSVPVYLGAPNIDDFAPGNKCYVNVDAFSSIKELSLFLKELDRNEGEYLKYLEWKKLPFNEPFLSRANMLNENPLLKLCRVLRKRI